MKIISTFGITMMKLYKNAVLSDPEIAELRKYLVAVNNRSGLALLWANGCNDHSEALSCGMAELVAESDDAEFAVIGPCNDGDACGKLRGKTYFIVNSESAAASLVNEQE